ncbi:MAG: hypothetical protein AABZ39_07275 [Spirochaetota bacterium]
MKKHTCMLAALAALTVSSLTLVSCSFFGAKVTDDTVKKYCAAWKNLKALGITKGEMPSGVNGLKLFEKAVKSAGFKGVLEFMGMQQKIGQAFIVVKAEKVMNNPKATVADFDKLLDDPTIPEATKRSIRDALKAGGSEKNLKYAKTAFDLLAKMVDKETLAVVRRNEAELTAVFSEK